MLSEQRIQELATQAVTGHQLSSLLGSRVIYVLRTAAREAAIAENEACQSAAGGALTYAGPDPEGAKNLQRLIVYVIRARREAL